MVVRPGDAEEDRVDQLGLAARELGHEGDDELVALEPAAQHVELNRDRIVDQLVRLEELRQAVEALDQRAAPTAQSIQTAGKGRGHEDGAQQGRQ
jgi:hypothetical protein